MARPRPGAVCQPNPAAKAPRCVRCIPERWSSEEQRARPGAGRHPEHPPGVGNQGHEPRLQRFRSVPVRAVAGMERRPREQRHRAGPAAAVRVTRGQGSATAAPAQGSSETSDKPVPPTAAGNRARLVLQERYTARTEHL